jgi:hypothetical protein
MQRFPHFHCQAGHLIAASLAHSYCPRQVVAKRHAVRGAEGLGLLPLQLAVPFHRFGGNTVLRRRDLLHDDLKQVYSTHLRGTLQTAPLSGPYLFHDLLPDAIEAQQKADVLFWPPESSKKGSCLAASPSRVPDRHPRVAPATGAITVMTRRPSSLVRSGPLRGRHKSDGARV